MKKTLLLTAIAAMSLGSAALSPALAAPISAPPQISESAAEDARDQVQAPRRASNYEKLSEKARQYEVNPDLAPTDADYAKARKDRGYALTKGEKVGMGVVSALGVAALVLVGMGVIGI